ncbi:MAG: hypothetical protein AB1451_07065 [Nitrospirota bacterium]
MNDDPHVAFFCDMTAIPAASRQLHMDTTKEVFGAVQAVRELPNGYAFQVPNGLLIKTAAFIDNERRCCPFLSFTVEVEPAGGPIWLRLTGHDGVKPFIRAEIGDALNESVAQAANFR